MLRTARHAALAALAATLVAAPAPAGARSAQPPAAVDVAACRVGDTRAARSAQFDGAMTAVRGATRMQMRFTLLERRGAGSYRRVRAPGLGVWRESRAGARRFVYRQEVVGLEPDAAYRVAVAFRWLDARGAVVRRAHRRSRPCSQPSALPNLRVAALRATDGGYSVEVRNAGVQPATDFTVALLVDGEPAGRARIASLGALATVAIEIPGPACARSVTAAVDPENRVRESDEQDNVRALACP